MASLLQTRKMTPRADPKIFDAFVKDEKNQPLALKVMAWSSDAFNPPWPGTCDIEDYDDGWFITLGNLPLNNDDRLRQLLGAVGNFGIEWGETQAKCWYWMNKSDVGDYSISKAGASVPQIWIRIADYQQSFHALYGSSEPLDEIDRDPRLLLLPHFLNEHCRIGFEPSEDTVWSIQPNGALGAAWIQLAGYVANPRTFKPCGRPGCTNLFTTDKSRGKPRKYCGDPCKAKAGRIRRASSS